MTETVLQLKEITKSFGDFVANDRISLSLKKGEILALLGENGAGKTTLMNILFGHYFADQGTISVMGEVLPQGSPSAALESGIGMVHQHFTLADNMSVLDNIVLGTEPFFAFRRETKKAIAKIKELSQRFGLDVDPKILVKQLSVGEKQRVEILKVLYRDSRILILDEPTAVLTPQESESLFATLKLLVAQGLSVIFISHKLEEVVKISHRCCVLRNGKLVFESITSKTDVETLASAMVGGTLPKTTRSSTEKGEELLRFEQVSTPAVDDGVGLVDVDMSLFRGEILGIAGIAGNGQAHFADLVSGLMPPAKGKIFCKTGRIKVFSPWHMAKNGIGCIPEDRIDLGVVGDMSVQENLILENYREKRFSSFGFLNFSQIKDESVHLIEKFDIRCQGPGGVTRQLSGGNIQKLILARVLSGNPDIILANQPTWGLDVGATSFVHAQLLEAKKRGTAVLLISEDLDEILTIADKVQVIFRGKLTPPIPIEQADIAGLGLAMSGQRQTLNPVRPRHEEVAS